MQMKNGFVLGLIVLLLPVMLNIAQTFEAIAPGEEQRYHLDFARLFFETADQEKHERTQIYTILKSLERYKGKSTASPKAIVTVLKTYDNALVLFLKHYTYLYLKWAINTKDVSSSLDASNLDAEFSKRTAFVGAEMGRLDDERISSFIAEDPELERYRFAIQSFARHRSHLLDVEAEEILESLSSELKEWQLDLYQKTITATQFGTIQGPEGGFDVLRDRAGLAVSKERDLRESGFKKLYEGYASERDLYAFALTKLASSLNKEAQIKNFHDAPEQIYFNSYWIKSEVTDLLEQIAAAAELYKRYQRIRADDAKRRNRYSEVYVWDVFSSLSDESVPRFTIDQARAILQGALTPLGDEYRRELFDLLDPANGRMDIVKGPNRKPGGFSKGFPGIPTVFYTAGFNGYYNDVRILTHESTHAIHRQLMKNNGVLPVYSAGPNYLFESFAIFNELLLPEYLYNKESDPPRQQYFLQQFLDGKGLTLFIAGQDAMIEQAIYEGVQNGSIKNGDDLDRVTRTVVNRFSIWGEKHKEFGMRWITNSLFYEDPLYNVNYVYGCLLALNYYDQFVKNPDDFTKRYIALMKNGFDSSPGALLKRFLNLELQNPSLLKNAIKVLSAKIDKLDSLLNKID
jgi:oligoendopeptidase F